MGCCITINEEGEFFFCNPMIHEDHIEKIHKQDISELNQSDSSSSIIMFEGIRCEDVFPEDLTNTPRSKVSVD